jgi:carbonic anhydrase
MRTLKSRWILAATLMAVSTVWAAERTGVLLTDPDLKVSRDLRAIKKDQDEVLALLKAGNKRHMKRVGEKHGLPRVMVVSCADSHVPPETVFNLKPGECYTNRAFGNVVDKVILASLEYGAETLGCHVLVVLGHTNCTALKSALDEYEHPTLENDWRSLNIKDLNERLKPAVESVEDMNRQMKVRMDKQLEGEALLDAVVRANILNTMRTIREQSPILWNLEQDDKLKVVGAIYHKDTGEVEWIKE